MLSRSKALSWQVWMENLAEENSVWMQRLKCHIRLELSLLLLTCTEIRSLFVALLKGSQERKWCLFNHVTGLLYWKTNWINAFCKFKALNNIKGLKYDQQGNWYEIGWIITCLSANDKRLTDWTVGNTVILYFWASALLIQFIWKIHLKGLKTMSTSY